MKLITALVFSLAVTLVHVPASQRSVRPAKASRHFMVYPCLAAAYIASEDESNIGAILSYGIANAGYMLLVAGIVSGRFTAFGLVRRLPTILTGIGCAVVGMVIATLSVPVPPRG